MDIRPVAALLLAALIPATLARALNIGMPPTLQEMRAAVSGPSNKETAQAFGAAFRAGGTYLKEQIKATSQRPPGCLKPAMGLWKKIGETAKAKAGPVQILAALDRFEAAAASCSAFR